MTNKRKNSTQLQFEKLIARYHADIKNIGTRKYKGWAYFWNYEYRHYLRDASMSVRKRVHSEFIKAGLSVDDESNAHQKIITLITGTK